MTTHQTADRPSDGDGKTVFLTGGTGYIGGRLAPRLLERGYRVRCLTRSAPKLRSRPWSSDPGVELVEADAGDASALAQSMRGCVVAYYLIHSMLTAGTEYRDRDLELAGVFSKAAAAAGVGRIVYLGGLGETGTGLSEHLKSRHEVEEALRSGGTPVTSLRAAMIIGSGSASFEILRYLVERLPVMITPRWVSTPCQPIAIRNVLEYLVRCPEVEATSGLSIDIGGLDVVTYREAMVIMAQELGLPRRLIIPVPVLTPRLSSLWIHLVTPLSARIARPLAEGLRNRVVCRDDLAHRLMPQQLLSVREAIRLAIGRVEHNDVATVWSDAGVMPGDPGWSGGTVFVDARTIMVNAPPERVFDAVCGIGGVHGYYAADWLWRVRGFMDRMIGGPGLRRSRRDPDRVGFGETLDFWRVTGIERGRLLELRAEMRLPGVATLTFEIMPDGAGRSMLTQTARFKPKGLLGLAYWHLIVPLHSVVFRGMLSGIARTAESDPGAGVAMNTPPRAEHDPLPENSSQE